MSKEIMDALAEAARGVNKLQSERDLYAGGLELIIQHPEATQVIRDLARFLLKASDPAELEKMVGQLQGKPDA